MSVLQGNQSPAMCTGSSHSVVLYVNYHNDGSTYNTFP